MMGWQHRRHKNSGRFMVEKNYYYWRDNQQALYLHVYVVPRAKCDRMVGVHGGKLKIQIAAPANDGKANERLKKFLALQFAVPQSSVTIECGECSQYKLIRIWQPKQQIDEHLIA